MRASIAAKIEPKLGRLQLIIAAMSRVSQALDRGDEDIDSLLYELGELAADYGTRWLDECADLLKTAYNNTLKPRGK